MQYNTLEARNQFSKLIDAALAGEDVVIARRGKPAIRFTPVANEGEIEERPGNPAWIAQWFKDYQPDPKWAVSDEEADRIYREERDAWD